MERLVTNHIRYEAETRRLLSENRAVFWNGHSTEDLLLGSHTHDFQCSQMKRNVLTLIDYSRAYDRVWWYALLLTMLRKGVSPRLIQWIPGLAG